MPSRSKRSWYRISAAVACAALAVSLVVGCDDGGVDRSGMATVSPVRMSGEAVSSLPDGFPVEVPVLAGAITDAQTNGDAELGPWRVVIEAPVSVEDAAAWYGDAFVSASWRILEEHSAPERAVIAFGKGAGAWTTVRIAASDTGSTIEMWVGLGVVMPAEAVPDELDSI